MTANSYDQLPYLPRAIALTHPCRLAAVARMLGLDAPVGAGVRVLDVGCAQGGNLFAVAQSMDGGTFVGIDYSAEQVAAAGQALAQLGWQHVEVKCADIAAIGEELGRFDYIIAHGIYSWLPDALKQTLLQLCARLLSDSGVAYISHNTYPGYWSRHLLRDIALYHCRDRDDPMEKVTAGREVLRTLATVMQPVKSGYAAELINGSRFVDQLEDQYVYHDILGDINDPVYFHQIEERAREAGLRFLGDAQRVRKNVRELVPQGALLAERYVRSSVDAEQYADFIENCSFRHTLFCQGAATLAEGIDYQAVRTLSAVTFATVQGRQQQGQQTHLVLVNAQGQSVRIAQPALVNMMEALLQASPAALPVAELLAQAAAQDDERMLLEQLLGADGRGFVTLVAQPPAGLADTVAAAPLASRYARFQATQGNVVTNLWLDNVALGEFDRLLLPLLDGSRDHDALLAAITGDAAFAALPQVAGHGPDELRATLEASLALFRRMALLVTAETPSR